MTRFEGWLARLTGRTIVGVALLILAVIAFICNPVWPGVLGLFVYVVFFGCFFAPLKVLWLFLGLLGILLFLASLGEAKGSPLTNALGLLAAGCFLAAAIKCFRTYAVQL